MKTLKDFITEDSHPHKVFVRDYSHGSDASGSSSTEWTSDHFKKAVKSHEAEEDYGADKGVGFKFKHAHQARSFMRDVNSKHKELVADHH